MVKAAITLTWNKATPGNLVQPMLVQEQVVLWPVSTIQHIPFLRTGFSAENRQALRRLCHHLPREIQRPSLPYPPGRHLDPQATNHNGMESPTRPVATINCLLLHRRLITCMVRLASHQSALGPPGPSSKLFGGSPKSAPPLIPSIVAVHVPAWRARSRPRRYKTQHCCLHSCPLTRLTVITSLRLHALSLWTCIHCRRIPFPKPFLQLGLLICCRGLAAFCLAATLRLPEPLIPCHGA